MAQAVVNPEELRRFAQNLKQFNAELRDKMGTLHGQLISLGDTWRDQEHEKFAEEFSQTMHVLAAFVEVERLVLQEFIGTAPWDHRPLLTVLVGQVVEQLREPDGVVFQKWR